MTPAKFMSSSRVYLRPVEKEDLSKFYLWYNDPEIRGLTGEVLPTSPAGAQAYLEKLQSDDPSRVWFSIVLHENDQLIGETGLLRMFPAWRQTDMSIILGEKSAWGKGYGREAMELMLDYAFGYLNFHRVSIGVVGSNVRALRFYEQVGFQREGVLRDGYYFDHRYQDFVMMSLLEGEYRSARGM